MLVRERQQVAEKPASGGPTERSGTLNSRQITRSHRFHSMSAFLIITTLLHADLQRPFLQLRCALPSLVICSAHSDRVFLGCSLGDSLRHATQGCPCKVDSLLSHRGTTGDLLSFLPSFQPCTMYLLLARSYDRTFRAGELACQARLQHRCLSHEAFSRADSDQKQTEHLQHHHPTHAYRTAPRNVPCLPKDRIISMCDRYRPLFDGGRRRPLVVPRRGM